MGRRQSVLEIAPMAHFGRHRSHISLTALGRRSLAVYAIPPPLRDGGTVVYTSRSAMSRSKPSSSPVRSSSRRRRSSSAPKISARFISTSAAALRTSS